MTKIIMVCIGCVCMMLFCVHLVAQSTPFTYQGQLKDGANPANGTYDLCFLLFTAASEGEASNPIYVDDLAVANGLFSAELDFGSSWFKGSDRWLEISVRPGSVSNADRSGYTKLVPRQKITAGPYALYSHDSARLGGQTSASFAPASHFHDAADVISGELPDARVSNALTISDSGSVDGGAIKTGTISPARLDSTVTLDWEVSDMIDDHCDISNAHHTWPLTDAEIPNDITISSSGSVDGGAIKTGTISPARLDSTVAFDGEVNNMIDAHRGISNAHHPWPLTDANIPDSIARDSEVMTIVLANDGSGSGLDADLLDGKHASAFMPAATDNWVNTTGDTMTGILNITGTNVGLRVTRTSSDESAVKGTALRYGGHFLASSNTGCGIYGGATSSSGDTYGGCFVASSNAGRGIYGSATSSSGETYGGYFVASSNAGRGIYGSATSTSGITYGGYFEAASNEGRGICGKATSTSGNTIGGYFVASSNAGRGIYGWASSSSGTTYGGYFMAESNTGHGIYGVASSSSGDTYGGVFLNFSTNGSGIYARAEATSGVNFGVRGSTNSPTGYAAYFTGAAGSANFFQRKVGIGRTVTTNMLEVEGAASKSTAGNWLANSDARIKTDVKNIENALETLEKVRLVDFEYTKEYLAEHPEIEPRRYMNVIAQEFAEVFPDYVKDSGETLADGGEILQVDAYPLTIYAAAAIQELNQKLINKKAAILFLKEQNANRPIQLDSLEARLAALESAMQKTKD